MKSKIIAVSGVLVVTNLLIGLLLSVYNSFNLLFTTLVLAVSATLIYAVNSIRVNDAIRVSFTILLTLTCFIKFILGLFAPEHLQDNWYLIACIVITLFEMIMLVAYHKKQV